MCNNRENLTQTQGKERFYYCSATQAIYKRDWMGLWMLPAPKSDINQYILDHGDEGEHWEIQQVPHVDSETAIFSLESQKVVICDFEGWIQEYYEMHTQKEPAI